ncbi:hypothetical protein IWX90DRAFT_416201 [Phyllosticta citrichinensis]|uniref:Uncharacterized protein n=1 Tax=Phyllosticta citrichinensis TaxID=1130410 RepID=A0ABR1XRV1_9PEZI
MLDHTCQRRRNAVRLRLYTALSPVSYGFSNEYIKPPRCLACQASNSSTPMGHLSTEYVDSLDLIPSAPSPTAPSRSLPSTKNKTPPIPPPKDSSEARARQAKAKKKKKQTRRSTSTPAAVRWRAKSSLAHVDRTPPRQKASESTTSLTHVRLRPRPRAPKDSMVEKEDDEEKASRRSTWVQSLDLNAFLGGVRHEEDVGLPPLPPIPASESRGGPGNSRASFFSRSSRVNPRDTFLDPDLAKPLPPPPPNALEKTQVDHQHQLRSNLKASRSNPRLSSVFGGGGKRSSALFGSVPPEDKEAKERLLLSSSPPSSSSSSPKSRWFDALSAKEVLKEGSEQQRSSTCLWMKMEGNGKVSYNGVGMMGLGIL